MYKEETLSNSCYEAFITLAQKPDKDIIKKTYIPTSLMTAHTQKSSINISNQIQQCSQERFIPGM